MWVCNLCNSEFEEPRYKRYWQNLDGENGWERVCDVLCPYCGSEEVEAQPDPTDEDEMTLEEIQEIDRRDFEEWEKREWHT